MLSLRTAPLLSLRTVPLLSLQTTPPMFLSLRTSDRCHWRGNPRPPSPRRRRGHPVIPRQSAGWRGNPFSPRPQAREPFLYLPPAGYFCLQRQKYQKTPLETTFQDFLGALRPVSNLPHVPRVIGFSRVPLSVKRTVPPQLSATALLTLPVATAGVSPSTAVTGREL